MVKTDLNTKQTVHSTRVWGEKGTIAPHWVAERTQCQLRNWLLTWGTAVQGPVCKGEREELPEKSDCCNHWSLL